MTLPRTTQLLTTAEAPLTQTMPRQVVPFMVPLFSMVQPTSEPPVSRPAPA